MPCSRSPGGVLSQHALQVVSKHALQQVSRGGSAPGGSLLQGGGLLLCPSVMAFWFGGLLIEGGLLIWSLGGPEDHNRRPPHQKATIAWWKPSPPGTATAAGGTHPTGMHSCLLVFCHLYHRHELSLVYRQRNKVVWV